MPRTSAVIGLPGDQENQVKLEATHSDMCRFNPNAQVDAKNFKLVEGNVLELCEVSNMLAFGSPRMYGLASTGMI